MASNITAGQILDLARVRHPAFANANPGDGPLLVAIAARQRSLILMFASSVDGLVNTTVDIATQINGALVGSSNGTPTAATTYADGWPLHQTAGGVPYVNFGEVAVAGDPFGANGGTPGFPLPADFLKLVKVACTYPASRIGTVDIISEVERTERKRSQVPTAFVSGNRLVPVRPLAANNSGDLWASIASIQLSYVALPTITAWSDLVMLPAALTEALIAGMAEVLAYAAPGLSANDKAYFATMARQSEQSLSALATDMTAPAMRTSVVYRG